MNKNGQNMIWAKQVPDKAGYWLRLNAGHRVEMSKVFKDSHSKLSIYWGWSPKSKSLIKSIKDKLKCYYWYGPLPEPPDKAFE